MEVVCICQLHINNVKKEKQIIESLLAGTGITVNGSNPYDPQVHNENFDAGWPDLKDKYEERFYRMWKYYLLSMAGAFRSRQNNQL